MSTQSLVCATSEHDRCNGTVLGVEDKAALNGLKERGEDTECACFCHHLQEQS